MMGKSRGESVDADGLDSFRADGLNVRMTSPEHVRP